MLLAKRMAMVQRMPQPIKVTIHYADSDKVNAMTLLPGGHVVIYRGLLEHMPHANRG